jgi:membrane associated rhomboid family serine protease
LDVSATAWLIGINVALFAAQLIVPLSAGGGRTAPRLETVLALDPDLFLRGQLWQLLTFQFLHGGLLHLLINCAMLYIFGRPVESVLGRRTFVQVYLGSGAAGGLAQLGFCLAFKEFSGWTPFAGWPPLLGASAGVFGITAVFACLNPNLPITTLVAFIIPVSMRAIYLVPVSFVIGLLGLLERGSGIAHAAHLGGLLAGVAYVRWGLDRLNRWRRDASRQIRAEPRRRPLPPVRATVTHAVPPGPPAPLADDTSPAEFIQKKIDPILDKISAHGIQSLTENERRILEAARDRIGRR